MTITSDPGRWTFTASGATGSFAITKPVFDTAALACYAVSVATSAIYVPTYTVTLAADRSGATVAVTAGLTAGDKVVVYRVPYRTQAQPLSASGPLVPKIVERVVDRNTADISALYEMVRRAARFPLADDTVAAELPVAALRANKPLGFGSSGELSVLAGLPSVPISVAWEPVVTAASLGAGLTAAGFSDLAKLLLAAASETAMLAAGAPISVAAPTGRLTLSTGVPVMGATTYTAKSTVYWTPYGGLPRAPVWDAATSRFLTIVFSGELSNDLTSDAANVGPAAAQPYSCYDFFLTATGHLVRGPRWRKAQTFTVTSASPAVFTTSGSHGFYEGQPIYLETTGALYTGLAVLTVYFVHVVSSTTFNVSTSLANLIAGTYVNTSGSQSGVHTAATFVQERGTGAGTTELETLQGIPVNKVAITNGPVARCGTYVGTGVTDANGQMNWHTGATAANGTEARLHLWNAYNRLPVRGMVGDTTDSWTYTTATVRPANASPTMRVSFVQGLQEDFISAEYGARDLNTDSALGGAAGVGFNTLSTFSGRQLAVTNQTGSGSGTLLAIGRHEAQGLGLNYLHALERGPGGGTQTWYGDASVAFAQSGLTYDGRF